MTEGIAYKKVLTLEANGKCKWYKAVVINDPLDQPTVPAGSRLILKFWDGRTDGRKIVITTERDCGRPRGSIIIFF